MNILFSLSREDWLILASLPLSYIVLCIYTCLHDVIHECGHGVVCKARGSKVQISLGSFDCIPPYCSDDYPDWSMDPHLELFVRPIYRTSATCCSSPCQDPYSVIAQEPLVFMGGLFGFVGMWIISISFCCVALLSFPKHCPKVTGCFCGYMRTSHVMFLLPDLWVVEMNWPPWAKWTVTLICCFTQLDLLNELFYAFTPSPLVIGEWESFFDGVRQWLYWTGAPPDTESAAATANNVLTGLWAALLVLYIFQTLRYLRIAARLLWSSRRRGDDHDVNIGTIEGVSLLVLEEPAHRQDNDEPMPQGWAEDGVHSFPSADSLSEQHLEPHSERDVSSDPRKEPAPSPESGARCD